MPRFAVLRDLNDDELRPIALVTEHDDAVRVHFAVDCGMRTDYTEPFIVTEPGGAVLRYEPGDQEYFDSVITSLSRGFLLSELVEQPTLDWDDIVLLYSEKVVVPWNTRRVTYAETAAGARTGGGYEHGVEPVEVAVGVRAAHDSMLARAA